MRYAIYSCMLLMLLFQPPGTKQPSDSPIYGALLVDTDDEKQKKLQEDRKKEYNELVQKVLAWFSVSHHFKVLSKRCCGDRVYVLSIC